MFSTMPLNYDDGRRKVLLSYNKTASYTKTVPMLPDDDILAIWTYFVSRSSHELNQSLFFTKPCLSL